MQNAVLKALSFLFEYIGEMGKDYIYAVSPLLEDALMDRDLVHRQTAASVVQVWLAGLPVSVCVCQCSALCTFALPDVRCGVLALACAPKRPLCMLFRRGHVHVGIRLNPNPDHYIPDEPGRVRSTWRWAWRAWAARTL